MVMHDGKNRLEKIARRSCDTDVESQLTGPPIVNYKLKIIFVAVIVLMSDHDLRDHIRVFSIRKKW